MYSGNRLSSCSAMNHSTVTYHRHCFLQGRKQAVNSPPHWKQHVFFHVLQTAVGHVPVNPANGIKTYRQAKAAARALCTTKTAAARYLFIRAIRKLTSRFDSRLWETDEPRFVKAAPILADIEEALSDLISQYDNMENLSGEEDKKLEKQTIKIADFCQKLQEDCMYDTLPVNQVRKASAWVRLMPVGKKKVLIVENADNFSRYWRSLLNMQFLF